MLNIITDKTGKKYINDVEVAFNKSVQLGIKDIPLYRGVLKEIDLEYTKEGNKISIKSRRMI